MALACRRTTLPAATACHFNYSNEQLVPLIVLLFFRHQAVRGRTAPNHQPKAGLRTSEPPNRHRDRHTPMMRPGASVQHRKIRLLRRGPLPKRTDQRNDAAGFTPSQHGASEVGESRPALRDGPTTSSLARKNSLRIIPDIPECKGGSMIAYTPARTRRDKSRRHFKWSADCHDDYHYHLSSGLCALTTRLVGERS